MFAILNTCKYFSNCARQDSKYEELLFWVIDLDELRLAGRSESSISPRKKRFYNNCVGDRQILKNILLVSYEVQYNQLNNP